MASIDLAVYLLNSQKTMPLGHLAAFEVIWENLMGHCCPHTIMLTYFLHPKLILQMQKGTNDLL